MTEHYCSEHETFFFQKGNMKGYAHPIKDENGNSTGKWCNEPKGETAELSRETPESSTGGKKEESHINPRKEEFAPQEIGLWYKEVGEDIRAGILPANDKEGKPIAWHRAVRTWYFARMLTVAGIDIKQKEE